MRNALSMKSILAAIDFSRVSDGIIATAVDLAKLSQGKLILFHVVVPPAAAEAYGIPAELEADAVADERTRAEKQLSERKEELASNGIEVETSTAVGHTVEAILKKTESVGASYIVIGSHGHGAIYNLLVGSTANGVLKRARCPIVIVPHPR